MCLFSQVCSMRGRHYSRPVDLCLTFRSFPFPWRCSVSVSYLRRPFGTLLSVPAGAAGRSCLVGIQRSVHDSFFLAVLHAVVMMYRSCLSHLPSLRFQNRISIAVDRRSSGDAAGTAESQRRQNYRFDQEREKHQARQPHVGFGLSVPLYRRLSLER